MNLNNESAFASVPAPTKRSSLSSRASKIPQKLAQSAFFSLKPSASTLINPNPSASPNNDRLSTRISHMLFRQRTTSESIIRESRSSSTQSLDYGSNHGIDAGRNYPSRSLDIPAHEAGLIYNKRNPKSNPLTAALDNNQTQSSPSSSPYSISSPERTDFYSYYYNSSSSSHHNNKSNHYHNSSNSAADTVKDEFNLFSPLSFSNSSVSSFADSILNHHITPPPSPMLPMIIKNNKSSTPAPTKSSIEEFANALIERCTHLIDLLNTTNTADTTAITTTTAATTAAAAAAAIIPDDMDFSHVRELELLSNQTMTLIDACDESLCLQDARQHIQQEGLYVSLSTMKSFLVEIVTICEKCLTLYENAPCLSLNVSDGFKKETPKIDSMMYTAKHYQELPSDQIDANASWFRRYFVGKPYHTFIGSLKQEAPANLPLIETTITTTTTSTHTKKSKSKLNSYFGSNNAADETPLANDSVGIISVIQERAKDFSGPGNGAAAILGSQYRIIIRSKETEQMRYIIHECMAKETQSSLEARGDSNKLDKCTLSHHDKRLRPFMSRNLNQSGSSMPQLSDAHNTTTSRMLRAAILSVCPNIDLRSFKELSAESTIMAGLEKDLLKYDEIHIPKHYKFGVLTIRDNQTTEESWFSNTGLSERLQDFLDIMGQKIKLKGYKGYSAGLDTKTGESGEYAYISKWNDFDIMYHVAPLMPSQKNDKQQVLRKKHIGNDIVCIIFLEGGQPFNPKAIRSQFLHVYIIVRPEVVNGKKCWRIEVLTKSNVGEFGPTIPSPPLLHDDDTLKEFLTLKLINAENAALKSDKFFIPNNKARLGLLSTHIQTGLSFNIPQVLRSASTNRLSSNKSSSYLSITKQQQQQQQQKKPQRPKSVNNKSPASSIGSNGSSRLLREAILDEEKRNRSTMASTDIPPMPSISRSTLLQDLKKGFVSGSKKIKGEKSITRKTSQLKISSTPTATKKALERVCEVDGSGSRPTTSKNDEMFVGKDINISSESFISTEQLFSSADAVSQPANAATGPTAKKSTAPAHHRFAMKPFPARSHMRPPNLILDTATTATATTSMSNSHVSGLSW